MSGMDTKDVLPGGTILDGRIVLWELREGWNLGPVYEATTRISDDWLVVKVLDPEALGARVFGEPPTRDEIASFHATFDACLARIRAVSSPFVARVRDGGRAGGAVYAVMDHVSGILPFTLRLHTEPRPGPGLFAGLLDGLAAVHEAGLVHGSLWPDNVLGASHGAVILDVAVRNAAEGLIRRMSRRIARVGWQRPGRFAAARFLSPEQARGEEPTPASDVWTAGVLLAETLSGQPILPPEEGPFNLMRVATGKVGVPPALRSGPFAGILGRALASRPVDRFPHGRAFATAFGRIDPAFWTVALNP